MHDSWPNYRLGQHTIAFFHDLNGRSDSTQEVWEASSEGWMQLYYAASLLRTGKIQKMEETLIESGEDEFTRGLRAQVAALLRFHGVETALPTTLVPFENDRVVDQDFLVLPECVELLSEGKNAAIQHAKQRYEVQAYRNQWEKRMLELLLFNKWEEYLNNEATDAYDKATALQLHAFLYLAERDPKQAQACFERSYKVAPMSFEGNWSNAFASFLRSHGNSE